MQRFAGTAREPRLARYQCFPWPPGAWTVAEPFVGSEDLDRATSWHQPEARRCHQCHMTRYAPRAIGAVRVERGSWTTIPIEASGELSGRSIRRSSKPSHARRSLYTKPAAVCCSLLDPSCLFHRPWSCGAGRRMSRLGRKWTFGSIQPISHAQRLLTANSAFQLGIGSSLGQPSVLGRSSALAVPENVGFLTSGLPPKGYAHFTLKRR